MLLCLFIAILSTLIWVNITVAEILSAKLNPYKETDDSDKKRTVLKNYLTIIMALFWAIVFRF
jgi:hypothetical protein